MSTEFPGRLAKNAIALFTLDAGDARVRKRIRAFLENRWNCIGFSFSRVEGVGRQGIFWEDIDLGRTRGGHYAKRLFSLCRAIPTVLGYSNQLRSVQILYAFNVDNLILCLIVKKLLSLRAPVIYECADIQALFTGSSLVSRAVRAVERYGLRNSSLLVTSSPEFIRCYFLPIQKLSGDAFLLENKIYPGINNLEYPLRASRGRKGSRICIGYFGSFRCARSLGIIAELASKGGVSFVLAGFPTAECAEVLATVVQQHRNIEYIGRFSYPEDLPALYSQVDLCWMFDWSSPGANSTWLLPNRLYEAGAFGVPLVASTDTFCGKLVAERGWGFAFSDPIVDTLGAWLQRDTAFEDITAAKAALRSAPADSFWGARDYRSFSLRLEQLAKDTCAKWSDFAL